MHKEDPLPDARSAEIVRHDHDLNSVLMYNPARAVGEYWAALDSVAAQQLEVAVDPGENVVRGGLEPGGRTRIDCLVVHLRVNRAGVGVGGFAPGVALPPFCQTWLRRGGYPDPLS